MKRVDPAVRRNFPSLGQSGNRPRGFGVQPRQPFKQADDDAQFRLAGDDGGVQRFRLGTVDDGHVGGRFAAEAAGNQEASSKKPASEKTKTRPRKKFAGRVRKRSSPYFAGRVAGALVSAVSGTAKKLFVGSAAGVSVAGWARVAAIGACIGFAAATRLFKLPLCCRVCSTLLHHGRGPTPARRKVPPPIW